MQKIIPLPYDAALKYTIARYYTPSGRCIQSVRYTGGRDNTVAHAGDTVSPGKVAPFGRNSGKLSSGRDSSEAVQVRSEERSEFRTRFKHRIVRDQGGIEPDFLVPQPPLSLSEGVLLSQGVYGDFAKVSSTDGLLGSTTRILTDFVLKISVLAGLRACAQCASRHAGCRSE